MKYRIQETITIGGKHTYYPQYRKCFIWFKFTGHDLHGSSGVEKFDTLDGARTFLGVRLEQETRWRKSKVVKRVNHGADIE